MVTSGHLIIHNRGVPADDVERRRSMGSGEK